MLMDSDLASVIHAFITSQVDCNDVVYLDTMSPVGVIQLIPNAEMCLLSNTG